MSQNRGSEVRASWKPGVNVSMRYAYASQIFSKCTLSSVASPICQEGQSERILPDFGSLPDFSSFSRFFPDFSLSFSSPFPSFSRFLTFFFAVKGDTLHAPPSPIAPQNQGSLKGESVVVAILSSRMEQSYCTSGFFRFQARFLTSSAPILTITHYLRTLFHSTRNLTHLPW